MQKFSLILLLLLFTIQNSYSQNNELFVGRYLIDSQCTETLDDDSIAVYLYKIGQINNLDNFTFEINIQNFQGVNDEGERIFLGKSHLNYNSANTIKVKNLEGEIIFEDVFSSGQPHHYEEYNYPFIEVSNELKETCLFDEALNSYYDLFELEWLVNYEQVCPNDTLKLGLFCYIDIGEHLIDWYEFPVDSNGVTILHPIIKEVKYYDFCYDGFYALMDGIYSRTTEIDHDIECADVNFHLPKEINLKAQWIDNQLHIECNSIEFDLKLYTLNGKVIKHLSIGTNSFNNLGSGIYLVSGLIENKPYYSKVFKAH